MALELEQCPTSICFHLNAQSAFSFHPNSVLQSCPNLLQSYVFLGYSLVPETTSFEDLGVWVGSTHIPFLSGLPLFLVSLKSKLSS